MTAIVEKHLSALTELCQSFGVVRLYLFGSGSGAAVAICRTCTRGVRQRRPPGRIDAHSGYFEVACVCGKDQLRFSQAIFEVLAASPAKVRRLDRRCGFAYRGSDPGGGGVCACKEAG
jgi:hypothetical protein